MLTLRDVTEQRQLEEELKHQAFHDALTGLPNRLLFQDRIGAAVAAARRDGTTAGVLFVDLDDFKVVNDTMGHGVGDELLVAAAARLAGLVRESDTAARLGGDEFALLIDNAADPAAVEAPPSAIVGGVQPSRSRSPRGRCSPRPPSAWPPPRTAPTPTSCSGTPTSPCTRRRRRASGSGAATSRC